MALSNYTSEEIKRELEARKSEEMRQEIIEMIESLEGGLIEMHKLVKSAIAKKKKRAQK